jgi:hypothetical protein
MGGKIDISLCAERNASETVNSAEQGNGRFRRQLMLLSETVNR